jgi:hypothetical protein
VIIWSRWGFLSFLAIGLGALTAFGIDLAMGEVIQGFQMGAAVLLLAAAYNLVLALVVYPRLDKPRPVTYTQPLPEPITHPNGVVQTHQVLPALDAQGQQLWARPRSTLLFIPAQYVWVVWLAGSAVLAGIGLVV